MTAGLVQGLVNYAAANGASPRALLAEVGLTRQDLSDPDNRIALASYKSLMGVAKAQTGDPALALRWGATVDMADLSIVGLIMNASRTMGEAFFHLQRYSRLALEIEGLSTQPHFALEQDEAGLWMIDCWSQLADSPEVIESAFARLVCGPRRFLAQPHVLEIHFVHPEPAYLSAYEAIFQCPITFEQSRNAMRLAPGVAEWSVALEPAYLLPVISRHAETLLSRLNADQSVRGRAEALLIETLPSGAATAAAVAAGLGVGVRTLHRRLREEGATYSQILNGLRARLARDLLGREGESVKNAAYLLGFSDSAAFSRAFKRWTGLSPKAFVAERARSGRADEADSQAD